VKNTKTFTSTISPELLGWLNEYSKQTKQTRRELLEDAIIRYRRDIKRKEMKKGFKRILADVSVVEFAEWGMDDYSNIVKRS